MTETVVHFCFIFARYTEHTIIIHTPTGMAKSIIASNEEGRDTLERVRREHTYLLWDRELGHATGYSARLSEHAKEIAERRRRLTEGMRP